MPRDACNTLSRWECALSSIGERAGDWLAVEDAVDLIVIAAAYAAERASVFNGAMGGATTVRYILKELAKSMAAAERPESSGQVCRGAPVRLEADVSCARSRGWEARTRWGMARQHGDWLLRGAS